MRMRVAVLIPTRGKERKDFVAFAASQIQLQTKQPDGVLFIDRAPENNNPDITARYKEGYELLKNAGFDVIIFWEDDDYYSPDYIDRMMTEWTLSGMPELFGISNTTYYHLINQRVTHLDHKGRASMCCTMIRTDLEKPIEWGDLTYKFTDLVLWKQIKNSRTFSADNLHIGIKHGIGLSGGVGHRLDFQPEHSYIDTDFAYLKKNTTQEAFEFYKGLIK